MCLNKRRIRNPHDGRFYWVKCNHCDACLQERANRHYARIQKEQLNAVNGCKDLKCFFGTLTYANSYVPFIYHTDLLDFLHSASKGKKPSLSIYRNVFCPYSIDTYRKIDFENRKIKQKFDFRKYIDKCEHMPYLRKAKFRNVYTHINNCIGVIYLPDIQRFFKRLKINLVRAGYEGYFSYYYTSELGGDYKRPHFHILVYFEDGNDEIVRSAIVKSWPYSDMCRYVKGYDGRMRQAIEIALNPAAYLSTYVNLRTTIPPLFADSECFKPKSRFSNGFGVHFKYFTPSSILSMFDKGSLRYPCRKVVNGVSTDCLVRLPKYVLTRYFPKFKGFNSLSRYEIFSILRKPSEINRYAKRLDLEPFSDECRKIITFIKSRRRCFLGVSETSFAYEHRFLHYCYVGSRIWQLYASESIKDSYENVITTKDLFEHFDNIQEFYEGLVTHDILVNNYDSDVIQVESPNDFRSNRAEHSRLKSRFDKAVKLHNLKGFYYERI